MGEVLVGTAGTPAMLAGDFAQRQRLVQLVEASAIDHFFLADHISFHTGFGMDGLVNAATLAAMSPQTKVFIGVYLLALRHPVPVARQLSSLAISAPGRILLGVGVGGEDRHEMEICGLDPARRGECTNHAMQALSQLLTGEAVSYQCDFFAFDNARIKPAPKPPIPILVGGRSDAALLRTARYGDGWLGVWRSPARFGEALRRIEELAASERPSPPPKAWQHGLQVWAGFAPTKREAKRHLAAEMEQMYQLPFAKFERYSPYGGPEEVADFLRPYLAEGASILNIKPCAPTEEAAIEALAQVAQRLKQT